MRGLRLAFRTIFKTPFVSIVAIVSLALGIGANAAIYSMFHQMLLQPLPVPHPERLVNFRSPGPQDGGNNCNMAGDCDEVFSYLMFRDLERGAPQSGLAGIAGHFSFGVNVAMRGQSPVSGRGEYVSGGYFPLLGVHASLGRLLGPEDDKAIGGAYVTVVSHGFWENQLGADPAVVGKTLTVNGQPMTIVGVGPDGFSGTTLGMHPDVFVPITMHGVLAPGWNDFQKRDRYWIYLFGRLAPGATVAQAEAAINGVYHGVMNDVEAPLHPKLSAQTMAKFRARKLLLSDGRRGQSSMIKAARTPMVLLFSITGIVLLIACANIANLLLARAATRNMEMAVRLSLGATRRQLVMQVLTESVLLSLLGGVAAIVVAHWTLIGIVGMLPTSAGISLDFSIDRSVLAFTALLSVGTGVLFGLAPAQQSTRPDLVTELRNNSGKITGGRGAARFRSTLVTAQMALSMALLIAAGLFIRSLTNVSRVDLGIKIENVTTFDISPALSGYDSASSKALYARVEQALAAIPGVTDVTSTGVPLLSGDNWGQGVSVEGFHKDPDTDDGSRYAPVGAGYFHALRIPLLQGRDFTETDAAGAPQVAIVNEAFAKKFHLTGQVVGRHMSVGNDSLNIEIVGLAKNAKYSQVKDSTPPVFVRPWRQTGRLGSNVFYVRSTVDPATVLRSIRETMKAIDPALPIDDLKTLDQQVKENVFLDRFISILSSAFALLATLLASIGLYGVLAYSVAQRTREIGVRMALGADAARVRRLVLGQVAMITTVGGVIGVLGALAIGRGAQSLLFQLKGWDPGVIVVSVVAIALVAFAAGVVPAWRASRVDPMHALRYE